MTRNEVKAVLDQLSGDKCLIASLLYGSGLRLMECLQLRVQDLNFAGQELLVHDGVIYPDCLFLVGLETTHGNCNLSR